MKGKTGKPAMRGGGMARKGVGMALRGGGIARKGTGSNATPGGKTAKMAFGGLPEQAQRGVSRMPATTGAATPPPSTGGAPAPVPAPVNAMLPPGLQGRPLPPGLAGRPLPPGLARRMPSSSTTPPVGGTTPNRTVEDLMEAPRRREMGTSGRAPMTAQEALAAARSRLDEGTVGRYAKGGRVKMTAGAGSGSGRLEKVAAHKASPRIKAVGLKKGGKVKGK